MLSRAGGFGEGALGQGDPLDHAHEYAQTVARALDGTVLTVLPVAGLLAETSHTGRLPEADARAVAALAGLDPFELIDLVDSDNPAPLTPELRDRLLDLVGEYGLIRGRDAATGGAHALNQWLSHHSGIAQLQQVLHHTLGRFAAIHRANRILHEIEQLAYTHPQRDHVHQIVHQVRSDPAMDYVVLFGCLRGMLAADPDSPVVDELNRILLGTTDAERVGLTPTADRQQVQAAIGERLAWVQRQSISTMSAAEDAALTALLTPTRRWPAADEPERKGAGHDVAILVTRSRFRHLQHRRRAHRRHRRHHLHAAALPPRKSPAVGGVRRIPRDDRCRRGALNRAEANPAGFLPSPKRVIGHGMLSLNGYDLDPALPVAAILSAVLTRSVAAHDGQPRPPPGPHPPGRLVPAGDPGPPVGRGTSRLHRRPRHDSVRAARGRALYTRTDTITAGDTIAVFDFGGGSLDIAFLTATDTGGFTVIAARGDNGLGGKNLDAIIRRWVGQELRGSNPELLDYLRREAPVNVLRALEDSIRRAKELLSEAPSATITVTAPGQQETLSLTRDEFDDLIAAEIDRAASLTRPLAAAGTGSDLKALYLTGGSSRIPLVHQRLAALGPIATLDDPKTVVARGALIATQTQAPAPATPPATPPPAAPVPASSWSGPQQPAPQRFPADVHADQPVPSAEFRKHLLIGAAALAAVVVIGGGIVAAQALGGEDSGADTTSGASGSPTTSSSNSTSSPGPSGKHDTVDAITGRWTGFTRLCSSTPSTSRSATDRSPTGRSTSRSGSPWAVNATSSACGSVRAPNSGCRCSPRSRTAAWRMCASSSATGSRVCPRPSTPCGNSRSCRPE